MKLLARTSLYYLGISLVLFVVGAFIFYSLVKNSIAEDVDENLYLEKELVLKFIEDSVKLPTLSTISGDRISFTATGQIIDPLIRDTLLFSTLEDEELPFRQIVFTVDVANQTYTAVISKMMYESEDLLEQISIAFALVALITLTLLLVFNWVMTKRMWKPFYITLDSLSRFELNKNDSFAPATTSVFEFKKLNAEIEKLTTKVRSDYRNLKEFSENASHEIQTPLAIVRAKLELLMNQNQLTKAQSRLVRDSTEAVSRLSKLNQSLLLLSKIENGQFLDEQQLEFDKLIEEKLSQFEELLAFRNLSVDKTLHSVAVKMNAQLADILLSNILSNAIKHNIEDGNIKIELSSSSLIISNSGLAMNVSSKQIFSRFSKSSASDESNGLGLAIAKSICEAYGFSIRHSFDNTIHRIEIKF